MLICGLRLKKKNYFINLLASWISEDTKEDDLFMDVQIQILCFGLKIDFFVFLNSYFETYNRDLLEQLDLVDMK